MPSRSGRGHLRQICGLSYVFGPDNSALRLKVVTQPAVVHEVGTGMWLAIDPKLMIAIT